MPQVLPYSPDVPVYLSPKARIEPLVCKFYAWPHLLSPAQLALHLSYRILPLLASFVDDPTIHLEASRDPAMYGGPFVSLPESAVSAASALAHEIRAKSANLLEFASDLRSLQLRLQSESGYSLNEIYAKLPESLQGLVELVYDVDQRASVRLIEPLVEDALPTEALQQILLHDHADGQRHFFMSTPRLGADAGLLLSLHFGDSRLDELSAMRSHPQTLGRIAETLGVAPEDMSEFSRLFTAEPPAHRGRTDWSGEGVRMRFFGHACVLFQHANTSILIDPFVATEIVDDGRFTIADLPEFIDYVVITHSHQDHFNAEMLLQIRHRVGCVVVPANNAGSISDPSMKRALERLGFPRIEVLRDFEHIDLGEDRLTSLPFVGEHADLNIHSKHAIALHIGGVNVLMLVDSDGRDPVLYSRIQRHLGLIDVMFIGMECHGAPLNWLYEPLHPKPINRKNNESRRLSGADSYRAQAIADIVKPGQVFVYAMGQDPWMKYIMGLEYRSDSVQLTESQTFIDYNTGSGTPTQRLVSGAELVFPRKNKRIFQ